MAQVVHSTKLQTPYTELPEVWLVPWGLSPSSKAPAALLLCGVCPRLSAFASLGWRVVVAGVRASTRCRPRGGGGGGSVTLSGRIRYMRSLHPAAEAKKADGASWVALRIPKPPSPTGSVACVQVAESSRLTFKMVARIERSSWSNVARTGERQQGAVLRK